MIKLDTNGKPFKYPTCFLNKNEYAKIVSEINSIYYSTYADKKFAAHYSTLDDDYCFYLFENHGFNDYSIYEKNNI